MCLFFNALQLVQYLMNENENIFFHIEVASKTLVSGIVSHRAWVPIEVRFCLSLNDFSLFLLLIVLKAIKEKEIYISNNLHFTEALMCSGSITCSYMLRIVL